MDIVIQVMGIFGDGHLQPHPKAEPWPSGELPGSPHLIHRLRELTEHVSEHEGDFVWIAMFEPTKPELAVVRELLDLPKLQVEDAGNPRQRPKAEFDRERAFIVFKLLEYVAASSDIESGQMSIFVGPGYVVTVRYGSSGSMRWVLDRIDDTKALLQYGPLSILHSVLDEAVDEYLRVIDLVSAEIGKIEVSVFASHMTDDTARIYELKRENLEIRRAVAPLASVAPQFMTADDSRLAPALRPYFRDIGDHLLRASDLVDSNDSLLLTMLMASTARLDLQQNSDMRRISAWVAIAAVPTMIAGIYGMNFDDMPELHQVWGYPAVLILMVTVCSLMYVKFKKSGWL